MENEMMYMPLVVLLIVGTAVLSAVVTQALPHVPKWWNALKNATKRKFTRKSNVLNTTDMVDVIIIAQLTERIDELEEQLNNVAANSYRRETNRKNNIRKTVREYLQEIYDANNEK